MDAAVHVHVLAGHDAGHAGDAVLEVDGHAVLRQDHVLRVDARLDGQLAVAHQVAHLAVDRHDVLRLDDVVAVDELPGARVTGHVHLRVLLGDDARSQAGQVVDDAVHGVFVTRDERGRQHDHVARLNRHRAVRPYRHARQGGHRLALGAGRHVDALGGRQFTDTLEVHDDALGDRQVSFLLGDAHIALHGAATNATRRPW